MEDEVERAVTNLAATNRAVLDQPVLDEVGDYEAETGPIAAQEGSEGPEVPEGPEGSEDESTGDEGGSNPLAAFEDNEDFAVLVENLPGIVRELDLEEPDKHYWQLFQLHGMRWLFDEAAAATTRHFGGDFPGFAALRDSGHLNEALMAAFALEDADLERVWVTSGGRVTGKGIAQMVGGLTEPDVESRTRSLWQQVFEELRDQDLV